MYIKMYIFQYYAGGDRKCYSYFKDLEKTDMGKFKDKMGKFGAKMRKFRTKMCKFGAKKGKFGLKMGKFRAKWENLGPKRAIWG